MKKQMIKVYSASFACKIEEFINTDIKEFEDQWHIASMTPLVNNAWSVAVLWEEN